VQCSSGDPCTTAAWQAQYILKVCLRAGGGGVIKFGKGQGWVLYCDGLGLYRGDWCCTGEVSLSLSLR
jgi:hypothetical protein